MALPIDNAHICLSITLRPLRALALPFRQYMPKGWCIAPILNGRGSAIYCRRAAGGAQSEDCPKGATTLCWCFALYITPKGGHIFMRSPKGRAHTAPLGAGGTCCCCPFGAILALLPEGARVIAKNTFSPLGPEGQDKAKGAFQTNMRFFVPRCQRGRRGPEGVVGRAYPCPEGARAKRERVPKGDFLEVGIYLCAPRRGERILHL